MPKILINEKDKTSVGTTGNYSNFAVLITGFIGRDQLLTETYVNKYNKDNATDIEAGTKTKLKPDKIQPDTNGVYEFTSTDDFNTTIGLVNSSEVQVGGDSSNCYWKHYGNQMAYELLNLGYPIYYKPIIDEIITDDAGSINKYTVLDVFESNFWTVFRDKANYDFRFITHGFLESSEVKSVMYKGKNHNNEDVNEEAARYKATLEARAKDVQDAKEALDGIYNNFKKAQATNTELEELMWCEEQYASTDFIKGVGFESQRNFTAEGIKIKVTDVYPTYKVAVDAVAAEIRFLNQAIEDCDTSINNANMFTLSHDRLNSVNTHIANLAKYTTASDEELPGRGDCIALIEMDENVYTNNTSADKPEQLIQDEIASMSSIGETNGKYCAMTLPSVVYKMSNPQDENGNAYFGDNKKFPGAFHYLACFAKSLSAGFAEWYAAAGYVRGTADYTVDYATVKLGELAINTLEPRYKLTSDALFACNVIANFRGSYYLWGNRTAHPLGLKDTEKGDLAASHFLNIRQLSTTIKKQLYVACRRFTFDPNSDTLWFNFVNAIKPTLDGMKADQGIRDYKILKVPTTKKATLKAKVRIIPIEAVEDFDIEVSLEDSFGETAVNAADTL